MALYIILVYPNPNHGFLIQIRRLRIEIEKLQWLHQQELSEMKHNLGENLVNRSAKYHACGLLFPELCYEFYMHLIIFVIVLFRADHGRDEAKSGTGEREVGD